MYEEIKDTENNHIMCMWGGLVNEVKNLYFEKTNKLAYMTSLPRRWRMIIPKKNFVNNSMTKNVKFIQILYKISGKQYLLKFNQFLFQDLYQRVFFS